MAAIVSSDSLGLNTSSLATLGTRAATGNPVQGRGTERAYVNVASGNPVLQDADERLVGSGLSVEGVRTYNSQGKFDGAYTSGPYNVSGLQPPHLEFTGKLLRPGTIVTRVDQDGGTTYYDFDTSRGVYLCTDGAGAYDTIAYDGNSLTWTDGDTGVTERYADGKPHNWALAERRDPDGNTLTYSYNRWGQVERISTASGESTLFDYTGGLLTDVRNVTRDGPAAGTVRIRYSYDSSNRLVNASVDLSPADNRISDGRVYNTRYAYEGVSDRVSAVTQDDGSVNRYTYIHLLGDYRIASMTDVLGQTTRFDYDLNARRTTVTDPLGLVTRYDYDGAGAGQLLRITGPAVQGMPQVRSFLYNSRGDVTQVTDARGLVTAMEYDRNGNLVLQRDAAGNTVARSYGARNQLLTETVYAMPDPDGAGAARPGQPQTSHYLYDSRLNLRFVVSAEGRVTEHRYNATGQRIAELHHAAAYQDGAAWPVAYPQPLPSNGGVSVGGYTGTAPTEAVLAAWVARQPAGQAVRTDYSYDFRGQLAQQTRYATLRTDGSGAPDGSAVSRFIYDANGRLLQTVAATGGVTRYTYDGLNRTLAVFDAIGNSTLVRYDDAGNRTLTTQANGLQDIAQYDRAGRLIAHMQVDTTGAVLGNTRYDYDADGRLRRSTDPTGVQHWMLYDAAGRLTGEIDGDGSLTEYVYNADDVLLQTVRYANRISARPLFSGAYVDELLRLRPAGSSEDVRTWRVVDNANRVVAQVDGAGTVTRIDYDGASRVLRTIAYATQIDTSRLSSAPTLAQVLPPTSSDDRITRRFYDQDGLLHAELDAAGTLYETRYDAAGQPVMRIAYARPTDAALRAGATLAQLLPAASKDDIVEQLVYDARGLLVADIDGEGYLTSFRYDGNGNRTETVRYAQALTSVQRAAFAAGGIGASLPPLASLADQHTRFTYDLLNRLITRTDASGTIIRNDYDSMGRLTASSTAAGTPESRTQTRRYDLRGRLVAELAGEGSAALAAPGASVAAVWQAYGTSYTYDAAGRMTSRTDANNHHTVFFYNVDSQMVYAINALGEVEAHRYDGLNQETGITRYATRLDATTLAALQGGLTSASVDATIAALANTSADASNTAVYDRAGRQIDRTDALGIHTRQRYDSFGDAIATTSFTETGPVQTRRHFNARGLLLNETLDAYGLTATTRQEYDAFGRIIASTDANGNIRTAQYDRLGRTVQIVDAMGATQGTAYDAFSRIVTRIDALGNATTLRYDDQARSSTLTTAEGVTVTTVMNRHGQTQSITDGNGNVTTFAYDRDSNPVAADTALAHTESHFDHTGLLIETVDGNGTSTTLRYDAANRVLSRTVDPGGLALTTSYVYDALGRIVQNTDPNGTVTIFRYDRAGQLQQQVIDPTGLALTTRFSWDARGQQQSVTDANGILSRYQYDGLGRRIAQTQDANGLALTTRHTYDANGNLLASTDATGHTSRYAYDAENRLRYSVDGAGDVTAMSYDANGRIIQTIRYALAISTEGLSSDITTIAARITASPTDITDYRVLDRDGHLAWTVDGRGAVNAYRHDGNGNVIEHRAYATAIDLSSWKLGSVPPITADDAHDLHLRTLYDAANRAIATLDGAGSLSLQHYDANGNLLDRTRYATPLPAGTSLAAESMQALATSIANPATDASNRYGYDAGNRLNTSIDGVGALTRYVYDSNGNLLRTIAYLNALPPGASPDQAQPSTADRVTDMLYDAANRLAWQVDALGNVTHRQYDSNGNLLTQTAYANAPASLAGPQRTPPAAATLQSLLVPNAQQDRVLRYAYDGANRLVDAIDAEGALTRTVYDALGQPLVVTRHAQRLTTSDLQALDAAATPRDAFIALLLQADPQHDRSTRQLYDAAGHVLAIIDAEGYATQRRSDALGRLLQQDSYARALPPGAAPATLGVLQAALTRDSADRSEQWTWDAAGHLAQHIDALGKAESWQVDALGNRIAWRNASGAVWQYAYDAAGRMTAETAPEIAIANFLTDASGNLVLDGQPTPQRIVTSQRYDALGNLLARTEADGRPEARTTLYEYDALGRQIRTVFPPVGVYDTAQDDSAQNGRNGLALRTERLQTLSSETRYDSFGDAIAGRDVEGNASYKTYDRMGRLAYEIDAAGYVTGYRRNAFGDIVALTRYALPVSLPTASDSAAIEALLIRSAADRSLQQTIDRNGRLVELTGAEVTVYDPDAAPGAQRFTAGAVTRNRYDAFGQQVESAQLKDPLADLWIGTHTDYDRRGEQVATLDALHYRTTFAYDAWGNLTERVESAQATLDGSTASSLDDRITRLTWDAANRKTSETRVNADYSDPAAPTVTVRGDLVTRYRYDAVGNLTRVTDAAGASTFSWYDALGRTTAVAAPARASTVDGTTLIPLTEFQRDAFGNVVAQIDRALGTQQASEAGYTPAAASADDRLTLMQYDSHSHLLQSTDAIGVSHYRSWDAHGQLAKAWQAVTTDDDGHRATLWQVWRRDALGHEVDWRESQDSGEAIAHGTAYNAFGEVVARSIDGGWQEFLDYDQAGRLWRSNAGDGQVKVMLHDLQGNTTALIQGNGRSALPSGSAASAALATDVRRTDFRYDLLGRAVAQTGPEQDASFFVADADLLRWPQPRAGVSQTLSIRDANGSDWTTLAIVDAGNGEAGVDIAALAAGRYEFELRQTGPDGASITLPGHLHITAGKPGEAVGADGVPAIGNVTVRAGTIGATSTGKDAAAWLVWGNAGEGGSQQFEYRTAGSTDAWRSMPVLARGNGFFGVDRSAIPAGHYEYRLQLIPADAAAPSRTLTGEVTLAAYKLLNLPATAPGGTPATVLQWPMPPVGTTTVLMTRAVGSEEWSEVPVVTDIMGIDAEGHPVGVQKVALELTSIGAWEYELSFLRDGVLVTHASGQIDIHGDASLPTLTTGTVAATSYTLPATSRIATVSNSLALRPTVHQTLDRWGNVLSVDDPRSADWLTDTRYNAANQAIEQTRPDAGQGAPLTRLFYDRMGRQIGMADANGSVTVNDYDPAGQLVAEHHADGGIVRHFYDTFGQEVRTIDANGHATDSVYDKLGRRIATVAAPVEVAGFDTGGILTDNGLQRLVETTRYDEAGRIVAHSDGLGNITRTRYDLHGNVIDIIQPLGQQTHYQYDHHNRQSGMTDANGAHASWQYDDFGHLLSHTDMGGAVTHIGYDSAGQMVTQATETGQDLRYSYDAAGKLLQIVDAANHKTTSYTYDAAGNRVTERTVQDGLLLQDNTIHFDNLGRMTDVTDRADGKVAVRIGYDRLGNRVHITTDIDSAGVSQHQDGWYAYDAMNRQVLVNAADATGALGANGHRVNYDFAGNRITDTWQVAATTPPPATSTTR
jgi:YD repeat-containing protein